MPPVLRMLRRKQRRRRIEAWFVRNEDTTAEAARCVFLKSSDHIRNQSAISNGITLMCRFIERELK